jgi:hypothetical protein
MRPLPLTLATVRGAFAPLGSQRFFAHATRLLVGVLLAPGTRPVPAVFCVMGRRPDQPFQTSPRVRPRAPWSTLPGGRTRRQGLGRALAPPGPRVLGSDETSARRRGARRAATGRARVPVRASPAHVVNAHGGRWVCLRLLVPVPWSTRVGGGMPDGAVARGARRSAMRPFPPTAVGPCTARRVAGAPRAARQGAGRGG